MRKLAHISDLHFGRIDEEVVEALLVDLRSLGPDLIVVSGDLTQRGHRHQFREARAFLDRLSAPYLVVPGNHDIPGVNMLARFAAPFARYQRYIERDMRPLHLDAEIAVLGLNTARPVGPHWNWSHGRINSGQIAHARSVFEPLGGEVFKVVVTHHPFLPPPDAPETRSGRACRPGASDIRELRGRSATGGTSAPGIPRRCQDAPRRDQALDPGGAGVHRDIDPAPQRTQRL